MADLSLGTLTITLTTQDDEPVSAKFDLPNGSSVTQEFPPNGILSNRLVVGVDIATEFVLPGGGALLDNLPGLSGAWSLSRALRTGFQGAFCETANSGGVDYILSIYNQSGHGGRDFTYGGLLGVRPAINTAGPNSVECADFDGTDRLVNAALGKFIGADQGFMLMSCIIDNLTLNNTAPWQNHGLLCDANGYAGIYAKNSSPNKQAVGSNWDGSAGGDAAYGDIDLGTPYVLSWRHKDGVLKFGVNGTETSVASGNTTLLTGQLKMGEQGASTIVDGKVFECVTANVCPDDATFAVIVADLMAHIGA